MFSLLNRPYSHPFISVDATPYKTGLINILCSAENFGKVWSACGKDEIQYTEVGINKCKCNYKLYLFYKIIIIGIIYE
jgi:hypothetical protein